MGWKGRNSFKETDLESSVSHFKKYYNETFHNPYGDKIANTNYIQNIYPACYLLTQIQNALTFLNRRKQEKTNFIFSDLI